MVIGGGSGVGRGISLGLAARGARLAVADIDAGAAEAVTQEAAAAGGQAAAYQVDATNRSALDRLAHDIEAAQGSTQVLVNTVGAIHDRPLVETDDAEWGWIFEVNVLAMMRSVQAFLPQLRQHAGAAQVVLTSSTAGLLALGPEIVTISNGLYTTTKHALIGLADMLRSELAPEGIGVSVLCPGLVAGNLSATSARHRPERFGGPLAGPEQRAINTRAMPNEDVGPIVAAAIEANRFYVFTHPEVRTMIEARHQALLDDLAFYADLLA